MPLGTFMGLATGALNNAWAEQREENARRDNYYYNEMSAQNADKRTRQMYEDFYSPSAQLKQLREAGLSPSLFFGGQGASGMSVNPRGAQGGGANGISPNMHFIDPLTAAQIDNIKADTAQKKENTEGQSYANELKLLENRLFKDEYELLTSWYFNSDNDNGWSLYESALNKDNFISFLNDVREMNKRAGGNGYYNTNQVRLLNNYYNTAKRLNTEINSLHLTELDNEFNRSIIKELRKVNYEQLNADNITNSLKAAIAQAKLDEEQRNAWNNVINSIENKDTKSAIIILSMILDRALSSYRTTPNITMNKNRQIRSNE